MRIIVIGSGLIGLASAYALRQRGHDVTVLERRDGPGMETSFANGSLLTPSMCEPWNAPGSWRVLLSSLGGWVWGVVLGVLGVASLALWGFVLVGFSSASGFARN